jgi:hypothetical protein
MVGESTTLPAPKGTNTRPGSPTGAHRNPPRASLRQTRGRRCAMRGSPLWTPWTTPLPAARRQHGRQKGHFQTAQSKVPSSSFVNVPSVIAMTGLRSVEAQGPSPAMSRAGRPHQAPMSP